MTASNAIVLSLANLFFFKLPFNTRDYILNKGGSQGAYPFGDLVSCPWGWVSVSALNSFLRSFFFYKNSSFIMKALPSQIIVS